MTYAAASQFQGLSLHLQMICELVAYVSCILFAGLAATGAMFYGGAAVYKAAVQVARDRSERFARAREISSEAARGVIEIEDYLARRNSSA